MKKVSLVLGLVFAFFLTGSLYAQDQTDLCHFDIKSDKSPTSQVYDLPATDYDTNGDLIEFSDGTVSAEVSGVNGSSLVINIKFGGRTYTAGLNKQGPELKLSVADGYSNYNLVKDVVLGGNVMGGKPITLRKGSYIKIAN